jgi:hypothetical protein
LRDPSESLLLSSSSSSSSLDDEEESEDDEEDEDDDGDESESEDDDDESLCFFFRFSPSLRSLLLRSATGAASAPLSARSSWSIFSCAPRRIQNENSEFEVHISHTKCQRGGAAGRGEHTSRMISSGGFSLLSSR